MATSPWPPDRGHGSTITPIHPLPAPSTHHRQQRSASTEPSHVSAVALHDAAATDPVAAPRTMSLQQVHAACLQFPPMLNIKFDTLTLYITLVRHLKPRIAFYQTRSTLTDPPSGLIAPMHYFLQHALELDDYTARLCWTCLKGIAWVNNDGDGLRPDMQNLVPLFLRHGMSLDIDVDTPLHELLPPTRTCIVQDCCNTPSFQGKTPPDLGEMISRQGVLHTLVYGPVPIKATSTYCRGCNTRYHHDFYVRGNLRTYYARDIARAPRFFQVTTHIFIETKLCELFATQMATAWTSARNCAIIYNDGAQAMPWAHLIPARWPVTFLLDGETVGDAFYIHALLQWHTEHGTMLRVPHQVSTQGQRWDAAIQERNIAIAGTGQPEWNHACNRCTRHVEDGNGWRVGAYRSVVTDGVALGHPCCGIHDCKLPLETSKARWCPKHSSASGKCAVVSCVQPVEKGHRTCPEASHRAAEARYIDHGKGLSLLKDRLRKSQRECVPRETDNRRHGDEDLSDDGVVLDDAQGSVAVQGTWCDEKPLTGVRKVFARFGRRRTHNEELCVTSCGVIIGRATFYGAEGPNSVREFWKLLFPTKASLPAVIWFDTNCKVAAMLEHDGDDYFDHVALPVDVFHFKSKHKESDGFCGRNCNPALWAELVDESTGQWVFNSSAAEQVNAWFGRFRAIVRGMRANRYNFFLDEMIMRRNARLVKELDVAGAAPYSIPRHELLHGEAVAAHRDPTA